MMVEIQGGQVVVQYNILLHHIRLLVNDVARCETLNKLDYLLIDSLCHLIQYYVTYVMINMQ